MEPSPSSARANALLRPLPEAEYDALSERLVLVDLEGVELLFEAAKPIEHVYFPLTALCSLVADTGEESMVEVGAIGNEGLLGVQVFLGSSVSPTTAYCQVPGRLARMRADELQSVLEDAPTLNRRLSLFSNVLIAQLGQNAACNRAHTAEQRCARWLLLTADRVGRDRFQLTHQFLAQMLGVRRATISEIAQSLAEVELISYQRGELTVIDRAGLTERACPCYATLRDQLDQLTR